MCSVLAVSITGRSELSLEQGDAIPHFDMCGPYVAAPVSAADNGRLTAESSTSVLDADGVEGQEKASLAPLFKWAEALFESQQHATNRLQGQPSVHNVRKGVAVSGVCCGVEWGEKGWHSDKVSHYLAVKISTTVSEHKQLCKHSQDAGRLLHCEASSSPHDSSYILIPVQKKSSPYLNSVFPTSRYTFFL